LKITRNIVSCFNLTSKAVAGAIDSEASKVETIAIGLANSEATKGLESETVIASRGSHQK
jgi:hypothetical protein